jgi:hypothetical protein
MDMETTMNLARRGYEAFARADVQTILGLLAEDVDWEFVGPGSLPYAGKRRTHEEVASFFSELARSEDIQAFEPREFIDAGEQVTVLGWERATARDTGKTYESEWVHVFSGKDGKLTRWRGFMNTAARFGM